MPTPRGDLRRQQIVEAALAEIRTQAVADVQLSAIADRAGMKASHVLYYFGSRDDVLIAAVAHAEQQLATDRAERLRAIDDPVERLAAFVAIYLPDDRHDPVWKLWIEGWLRSPSRTEFAPVGRKADEGWMADVLDCFAHVTARGGTLPEPAQSFARRVLFLLDGLAVHVLADHIDTDEAAGFAMASLRSGSGVRPKTLGALAVIGLVVAFSLSSTLVKRAESPGVLVAFWRMIAVSILWNAVLWGTGRSVTRANIRQVWLPGVFFGLNLAVFFAGATHNSVANAALIGSLAPFLIVPVGAWLFAEYINPRALVFAVIAFGGVVLVLLNAPSGGDASLEGNVLGVIAMVLLVAYVTSTRAFRGEMDVTTFMSTICPIAALAVLPIALAHGDVLGMSATGWLFTAILTLTSGIAAQGLLVYAQKTIQIGTIGISQQAQPALAVMWSFLLLGEAINGRQATGIALVIAGLAAFIVAHQRDGRLGRAR